MSKKENNVATATATATATTLTAFIESVKLPARELTADEKSAIESIEKARQAKQTAKAKQDFDGFATATENEKAAEKALEKARAKAPKSKEIDVPSMACKLFFKYGFAPLTLDLFSCGISYCMVQAGKTAKIPSVRTTCAAFWRAYTAGYTTPATPAVLVQELTEKAEQILEQTRKADTAE